jgi:hypothetical protein
MVQKEGREQARGQQGCVCVCVRVCVFVYVVQFVKISVVYGEVYTYFFLNINTHMHTHTEETLRRGRGGRRAPPVRDDVKDRLKAKLAKGKAQEEEGSSTEGGCCSKC